MSGKLLLLALVTAWLSTVVRAEPVSCCKFQGQFVLDSHNRCRYYWCHPRKDGSFQYLKNNCPPGYVAHNTDEPCRRTGNIRRECERKEYLPREKCADDCVDKGTCCVRNNVLYRPLVGCRRYVQVDMLHTPRYEQIMYCDTELRFNTRTCVCDHNSQGYDDDISCNF